MRQAFVGRNGHVASDALRRAGGAVACAAAALLAGCGGGGSSGGSAGGTPTAVSPTAGAADCSVEGQKAWLAAYMDEWYWWRSVAPRPDPLPFPDAASYFEARRYTGGDPSWPADRYSWSEPSESFERFFEDGATLGYGVSLAALEIEDEPTRPLRVRYVEPASPAAAEGVRRGDEVLSIDGRSAASVVAAQDYAAFFPTAVGQPLKLVLRDGAGRTREVTLAAAVFALTPVTGATVVPSPGGRRLGYVAVKDLIDQALPPLATAFAGFEAAGITDAVVDLRYNGGGLVSAGATVASHLAGARAQGRTYAELRFNDRHSASNRTFPFTRPSPALGLSRVFVLTGPRTCSASEQIVSGLRGVGVEVVTIGDATCGKPVGFLPVSSCGTTYNIVNFESVNALGAGRYFDGLAPTCRVAEDFTRPQGSSGDPLMAAAVGFADSGRCPAGAAAGTARALGLRGGGGDGMRGSPQAPGRMIGR